MVSPARRVRPVALPPGSAVAGVWPATDYADAYADAYAVELPPGASTEPEVLARFLFERPSRVGRCLLRLRDALVGMWGLKTATHALSAGRDGGRIGIFRVYGLSDCEILLGEDDRHLDFRVSVLCSPAPRPGVLPGGRQLVLSTVIRYHNVFGRLYFLVVGPFHRALVKSTLRGAASVGWPGAGGGRHERTLP